jgi:phosphorylcholine metabolism protein LicD
MSPKAPKMESLAEFLYLAENMKKLSERYVLKSQELLSIDPNDFCPEMFDRDYELVFTEQQKLYPLRAMLDVPPIKYDKDNQIFREVLDTSIKNFSICLENITRACVIAEQKREL